MDRLDTSGLRFDFEEVLRKEIPKPELPAPTGRPKTIVCTFWAQGLCKKGDQCSFLHKYKSSAMQPCPTFMKYNYCHDPECLNKHIKQDDKAGDCAWYARGFCRHGSLCKLRHTPTKMCLNWLEGFCPLGPDCKWGHPSFALPLAPMMRGGDDDESVVFSDYEDELEARREVERRRLRREAERARGFGPRGAGGGAGAGGGWGPGPRPFRGPRGGFPPRFFGQRGPPPRGGPPRGGPMMRGPPRGGPPPHGGGMGHPMGQGGRGPPRGWQQPPPPHQHQHQQQQHGNQNMMGGPRGPPRGPWMGGRGP